MRIKGLGGPGVGVPALLLETEVAREKDGGRGCSGVGVVSIQPKSEVKTAVSDGSGFDVAVEDPGSGIGLSSSSRSSNPEGVGGKEAST